MPLDLSKPAVEVKVQRAEEFGKALYELHKDNLKHYDIPGTILMREWEEISDIAKDAWSDTAVIFLQQFSED